MSWTEHLHSSVMSCMYTQTKTKRAIIIIIFTYERPNDVEMCSVPS